MEAAQASPVQQARGVAPGAVQTGRLYSLPKNQTIPSFQLLLVFLVGNLCCHGVNAFTQIMIGNNYAHSRAARSHDRIVTRPWKTTPTTALSEASIISGKEIASTIRTEIKADVEALLDAGNQAPGLAVVLVGSRRDSQTYVNMKTKACKAAGIQSFQFNYDKNVLQEELLEKIQELNADSRVHGILIQLPLPDHMDQDVVLNSVDPEKDVDGLHPANVARLAMLQNNNAGTNTSPEGTTVPASLRFSIPCTPLGCMELLGRSGVQVSGKHAVVIGRSNLVGLPMHRLLLAADATVTIVHSRTQNIAAVVKQCDIVIAAVGKAQMVKSDWLKEGAIVIDVGINSVDITPDKPGGKPYKLVGDVDYENAKDVCSKITPVPGGVGPMTIAMLLRNTLNACKRQTSLCHEMSASTAPAKEVL